MPAVDFDIDKDSTSFDLPVNYNNTHWSVRRAVREQYIQEQDGLCHHCQRPLDEDSSHANTRAIDQKLFPDNFFAHPVHLHHDHKTGLTIGAVHSHCNAILWQYYGE